MLLTIVIDEPFPGSITVHVSGDVDRPAATRLWEAIVAHADPARSTVAVAVDLHDVRSFGSAGLSALLAARAVLWLRRVPLCVAGSNEVVDRVMRPLPRRDRFVGSAVPPHQPPRSGPGLALIASAVLSVLSGLR